MSDKQRSTSQARRKPTPGPCKPTPGPWKTELRKDSPSDVPWYPIRNLLITAGTREYKINCNCAVDLANARLMAAAPEMYDALRDLYNASVLQSIPFDTAWQKAISLYEELTEKIEGDE